jgi:urease accessory protein
MSDRRWSPAIVGLALGLATPLPLLAHTGDAGAGAGFVTGFLHPLGGLDHVLAMLAVGLWGAQLGNPALWVLPVAFPLVMAFGGAFGIVGLPLPAVELGIRLSVIALGSVIALNLRPPLWAASALVAFFAIFHGYAHGVELPGQTGAVAYSAGFVSATGGIHLTGIGLGFVVLLPRGLGLLRTSGAAIAAVGLVLTGQLLLR